MKILVLLLLIFFQLSVKSQVVLPDDAVSPRTGGINTPGMPRLNTTLPNKDSAGFKRRNDLADSITISYQYLDSNRRNTIDSSINDFDTYFSIPSNYQHLGNNGAAAFPLIFQPNLKAGWDAGFHAYDIYRYTLQGTRLYRTTRPFSMLGYQLATGKEQMIKAFHTQNPKPNLNVGFDFRIINAPGLFTNQNTNHNNFRIFGNYQGRRKRYNATIILAGNNIRASQNGGIREDSLLKVRKDRFSIPVNTGDSIELRRNPFITTIITGITYKEFTFFLRQSYDVGKRDSVAINDSTTEHLFYPKLRFQHTLTLSENTYRYNDWIADSSLYKKWYNLLLPDKVDTVVFTEKWKVLQNDFSLIQFPDTRNASQFLLAGITHQSIRGTLKNNQNNFYNILLHGEYRNRTKNRLWDILLKGEFYLNGLNEGDYSAQAKLGRYLNKKFGDISLFFINVNRTPSFVFDNRSSYSFNNTNDFKKENITSFGATATNPLISIGVKNNLLTNYTYFYNYYQSRQASKLINILQFFASKKIKITKRWNYYADATIQLTDATSPVKVPFLYTRSRFAYEGVFFKNLNLSAGLEIRYYTPYKAYDYSPVVGQFIPQDTVVISNTPDVTAFVHFRIKTFTAFIRTENLNTVSFSNGFQFTNNNYAAPHYPTPGMIIRFGIQWWFIN
ncbi:MAG: putative porin [Ferruginibacter sp.]